MDGKENTLLKKNVTMCQLNQGNHHTLAWPDLYNVTDRNRLYFDEILNRNDIFLRVLYDYTFLYDYTL